MKKLLSLSVMALVILSVMPVVLAAGVGAGFGGSIGVEEFEPMVFQCGDRILSDEAMQPWRYTGDGAALEERAGNYLFEGERYQVDVLVFDKNKIQDVLVDLVLEQYGDDYSINCIPEDVTFSNCNARIDEEVLTYDSDTMQGFRCTITALDSEHMQGDMWLTVQACDNEQQGGACTEYDELTPLFINPMIELGVDGELDFSDVRPGTASYSQIVLENEAEGGVLLDMFITGKDWPAADMELGRCQNVDGSGNAIAEDLVNYLPLGAFRYYAENGAYDTRVDAQLDTNTYDNGVARNRDAEGYVNIQRQLNAGFEEAMFDEAEIIQAGGPVAGALGYRANTLSPGGVMALTFRLMLPEPCYGEFESQEDGSIFIWAEAI